MDLGFWSQFQVAWDRKLNSLQVPPNLALVPPADGHLVPPPPPFSFEAVLGEDRQNEGNVSPAMEKTATVPIAMALSFTQSSEPPTLLRRWKTTPHHCQQLMTVFFKDVGRGKIFLLLKVDLWVGWTKCLVICTRMLSR